MPKELKDKKVTLRTTLSFPESCKLQFPFKFTLLNVNPVNKLIIVIIIINNND